MRMFLLLLLMIATPAVAQTVPAPVPAVTQSTPAAAPADAATPPVAAPDPAAAYITAGQDEPGYRSWYLAAPKRAAEVQSFNDYLTSAKVAGIVPTWELLRTATAWKECGQQPFEIPPTSEWPHIIQTLRYIRDYVIPAIGPVEPVSVYRNPILNKCAGGAPQSAHKEDSAIDMVPLKPITRDALIKTLCDIHTVHGAPYDAGLGFYAYLRFHVDSEKFRRWNMDPAVLALCPPIIHSGDIASVGQPLPKPVQASAAAAAAIDPLPAAVDTKPQSPVSQSPGTSPAGQH